MTQENDIAEQLKMIMEALGLADTKADITRLASELSRHAGQDPPWTYKYLHSILRGHLDGSQALRQAIMTMGQALDGAPQGIAGGYVIRVVVSPADHVPSGVYIPAGAQVRKCKRPGCPVWFLKDHPFREYHDPSCRPDQWAADHPEEGPDG